jgi:glycosyltransferase involved in cell wall biosynthesis
MTHIAAIVPIFRSHQSLRELHERLSAVLKGISSDYEIIFVEDCGGDGSWELIKEIARNDAHLTGVQFSRNFGQHYGITAGLDLCDADWVVVMDGDLQDPPEEIPLLYSKALEGYDVVHGRKVCRHHPWLQELGSAIFSRVFNAIADTKYDSQIGNFRIVSRKVVETFCSMREQLRYFGGLINWMGFAATVVDVSHAPRREGRSSYSLRRRIELSTNILIAYSDKPLRLSIQFGFIIAALAFSGGVYLFLRALLFGFPVMGWGSLIVSLYFLGGIIICNLGILGIYLGKVYDEVKRRPLYVIREIVGRAGHSNSSS